MKILAVCNTPYQIMCIVNLKLNTFAEDEMDIIISDHMTNAEPLIENIERTSLFDNVYYASSFDYCRRRGEYAKRYYQFVGGNLVLKKMVSLQRDYDVLMVSNVDPFADCLYETCYYRNRNIKVYTFEDGYGTYVHYGDSICRIKDIFNRAKTAKLARCLGRRWVALHIEKMYLLAPDKLAWNPTFEVVQMPLMSMDDLRLRCVLNRIFSYESMCDEYDKKIIFFEESYRREGVVLPDVLLLELIASIVGKENIMVKVHPRSNCSLFEELGYETNKDTAVPWELIWMNENGMSDKLLVTISSGSVSTPFTMLNSNVNAMILKNLLYGIGENSLGKYHDWLDHNIYQKNREMFYLPNSVDELYAYFEHESREGCV